MKKTKSYACSVESGHVFKHNYYLHVVNSVIQVLQGTHVTQTQIQTRHRTCQQHEIEALVSLRSNQLNVRAIDGCFLQIFKFHTKLILLGEDRWGQC
jgi:hypothetical protein